MPLTATEAFKVGCLQFCASRGLSTEETLEEVRDALDFAKSAAFTDFFTRPLESVTNKAMDAIGSVGSTAMNAGLATALLGPPAVGIGAGLAAAKLTDVDADDPDTLKKQELIDEYRRQAATLRQRRKSTYRLPTR